MFKPSIQNNLSNFVISQDYYELPKRTIRSNGKIYHIFKLNNFREILNIRQNKAYLDFLLQEFTNLLAIHWKKKYESLTVDMTKDEFTGQH